MNGKKLVCRHAGPPSSVRIGGITLTSCARQPIFTRSAWRSSVISRQPTTSASASVWSSSARCGARLNGPVMSVWCGLACWCQTFHSSTLIPIFLRLRLRPATASAVATTVSIMRSRSSEQAR